MTNKLVASDYAYIFEIRDYLIRNGKLCESDVLERIRLRKEGHTFSMKEHLKGMIYAFLSNQVPWVRIEPNLKKIDKLFFNYNYKKVYETDPIYFINGIRALKCGNRSIRHQMNALRDNIDTLLLIEKEHGSIDSFYDSMPVEELAERLTNIDSPYRLRMLGQALIYEYFKSVGIDTAKPDYHLCMFLGQARMGVMYRRNNFACATEKQALQQIDAISEKTGLLKCEIDNIIWSFCATGYAEICAVHPQCDICPIHDKCKYWPDKYEQHKQDWYLG